jgi:hypothetical protein
MDLARIQQYRVQLLLVYRDDVEIEKGKPLYLTVYNKLMREEKLSRK